jgi:putative DNA primase/helicase
MMRAALATGLKEAECRQVLDSARKKGDTPRRAPEPEKKKRKKKKDGDVEGNRMPDGVHNLTDLGNSKRYLDRHGHNVRFWTQRGRWLVWDEQRWKVDQHRAVELAKDTVEHIPREALQDGLEAKQRNAILTWAKTSENITRIGAVTSLARSARAIDTDMLDQDLMVLCCNNGTLDLKTGEMRAHRQKDLITKLAPVDYDPDAECPLWMEFLNRVMNGKSTLVSYLQRAVGYSLTGLTDEQCLFFLYGTGANGKSTFLETIQTMLGEDFTRQMDFTDLDANNVDQHPARFAKLVGARWVTAVESEQGRRLAEVVVKQMTGGDRMSARFMRQDFFEFVPQFKLWLAGNHKPIIRGTDEGIWRRIKLVPFTVTIPEEERDKQLKAKLLEELPGIFAWAVKGCLIWQADGLQDPKEVTAATASYRGEMDILAGFLAEHCIVRPGVRCASKDLYDAYRRWAEEGGERAFGKRKLGQLLQDRGFTQYRTKKQRGWDGLTLRGTSLFDDEPDDNVRELF